MNISSISDQTDKINYTLAKCCNPMPGEEVVGFLSSDNKNIEVHRTSCDEAIQFMSTHGDRIVKSKWINESVEFLAGIKFVGIDKPGLLNKITKIVSLDMKLNIQSVTFDTSTGLFEGIIKIYINDTNLLNQMIENFRKIEEIKQVYRITRN